MRPKGILHPELVDILVRTGMVTFLSSQTLALRFPLPPSG